MLNATQRSFRGRLALSVAFLVILVFLILGGAIWMHLHANLTGTIKSQLRGWVEQVAQLLDEEKHELLEERVPQLWSGSNSVERSLMVFDSSETLIFAWEESSISGAEPWMFSAGKRITKKADDLPADGDFDYFSLRHPETREKWQVLGLRHNGYLVVVATDLEGIIGNLRPLRNFLIGSFFIATIAICVGCWVAAGRALIPLNRMVTAAARVGGSANLAERVSIQGEDYLEFASLVRAINGMMDRLEENFHQVTRFTADASHELKTPIALLQAEVDTAIKSATPGAPETNALVQISEEVSHLKRISEALLFLSKADAGRITLNLQRLDLSEEIRGLCEDAEVLCGESGPTLDVLIGQNIFVEADRTLLMQAAQNLISNAIKYNRPQGKMGVMLCTVEGEAWLEVWNTGSGIPRDQQKQIFDRFHRVDRARGREPGGTGLGLNLAHEIVHAHGGELELVSGEANDVRFRLRLPALRGV